MHLESDETDDYNDGVLTRGKKSAYMYLAAPSSYRKSSPGPTFFLVRSTTIEINSNKQDTLAGGGGGEFD